MTTKIFSLGFRCSSSGILKRINLKTESYPFDWLISNLEVIRHCIDTNFKEFLNKNNYINKITETSDYIENNKVIVAYENILYNKFYENNLVNDKIYTYTFNLAMNHHNILIDKDYQYYRRCVERFLYLMNTEQKKIYLHINKVLYNDEYNIKKNNIVNSFIEFHNFIETKTKNIIGLFFILVKNDNIKECELININSIENKYYIYLINTTNKIMDTGEIFMGECEKEINIIINEINKVMCL